MFGPPVDALFVIAFLLFVALPLLTAGALIDIVRRVRRRRSSKRGK